MISPKVLLVDDNPDDLFLTLRSLRSKNCDVVPATNVNEALHQIAAQQFDILITDLHMPDPGDGFAVVTAMRHSQPSALTLVVSGYPDVQKSMTAILLQADEILLKPFDVERLADLIHKRRDVKPAGVSNKESVASILERDAGLTVERWLSRVKNVKELADIHLTADERTRHLPEILRNISARLRAHRILEAIATPSPAAVAHGRLRYLQGYSASLIVQESRIFQVCIFETLQDNLVVVDFSTVLPDIMLIADEVDAQLAQSIESFLHSARESLAASAH